MRNTLLFALGVVLVGLVHGGGSAQAADFPPLLDGGVLLLASDGGAVAQSEVPCGEQFAIRCTGTAATPPTYRMCLATTCAAVDTDMALTPDKTYDIALEPRIPNVCSMSIRAVTNSSCRVYKVRPRSLPASHSTVK